MDLENTLTKIETTDHESTKVDCYVKLGDHWKQAKHIQEEINTICKLLNRILVIFKRDIIKNSSDKLIQSALKCMGYFLHHNVVTTFFSDNQASDVLEIIKEIAKNTKNKSICNLAVWCISVQGFNFEVLSKHLLMILEVIKYTIELSHFQSQTIEHESLAALEKLLKSVPSMKDHIILWAPLLYRRLLSDSEKIRQKADFVFRLGIHHLFPPTTELSKVLLNDLESIIQKMNTLMENQQDLLVIKVWGYLIMLLGSELMKNDLINAMLRFPQQTFQHFDWNVRVGSFQSWDKLVDCMALHNGRRMSNADEIDINYLPLNPKRLKLLMLPIITSFATPNDLRIENHSQVDLTALQSWIHLIETLGKDLRHVFKLVLPPCIDQILLTGNTELKEKLFSYLSLLISDTDKTSTTSILYTPFSRLTELVNYFIKLFASVVTSSWITQPPLQPQPPSDQPQPLPPQLPQLIPTPLCDFLGSIITRISHLVEENIKDEQIKFIWREIWCIFDYLFVKSEQDKYGISQIWMVLKEVISTICTVLDKSMIGVYKSTKLENILISFKHESEQKETMISPVVYLCKVLLDFKKQFLACDIQGNLDESGESSKIYAEFLKQWSQLIHLISTNTDMDTSKSDSLNVNIGKQNVLSNILSVMELLTFYENDDFVRSEEKNDDKNKKRISNGKKNIKKIKQKQDIPLSLSLWVIVTEEITKFAKTTSIIGKTVDTVHQDFSTIYSILIYPLRYIITHQNHFIPVISESHPYYPVWLLEHTINTFKSAWKNLFQIFHSLSNIKIPKHNQNVKTLSIKINSILPFKKTHSKPNEDTSQPKNHHISISQISPLIFILEIITDEIDISNQTTKKKDNLINLFELLSTLMDTTYKMIEEYFKEDLNLVELKNTATENKNVVLSSVILLLDISMKLFTKIKYPSSLLVILKCLAQELVTWFGSMNSVIWKVFGGHLQNFWDIVMETIQRVNKKSGYDDKLLKVISPLLVTGLKNKNRHIKNNAVGFWNTTFGKIENINYPPVLKPILESLRSTVDIKLPNWDPSDKQITTDQSIGSSTIQGEETLPEATFAWPTNIENNTKITTDDLSQNSDDEQLLQSKILQPKISKPISNPSNVKEALEKGYVHLPSKPLKRSRKFSEDNKVLNTSSENPGKKTSEDTAHKKFKKSEPVQDLPQTSKKEPPVCDPSLDLATLSEVITTENQNQYKEWLKYIESNHPNWNTLSIMEIIEIQCSLTTLSQFLMSKLRDKQTKNL